jgi:mannose-6-phosphate isomerase-like protein (cupin superfamily)
MNTTTAASGYEEVALFGALAILRGTAESTDGKLMLIEHVAPRGIGSPLHVHHNEDEWFYVIEGELTIWRDGETVTARSGDFVFGPRDVPHTFIVSSDEARFLLATQPADFEGFVRALAAPVETLSHEASGPPDLDKVMAAAADYGIEILGPSGIPA